MAKKIILPKRRVLHICGKTSDRCYAQLEIDGKIVKDNDGYVPTMMPGDHYGDYIELEIDIDTGMILNWKKPSEKTLNTFIATGK